MNNTLHSLLVVDDSRTSREMLCSQLERRGYCVTGAASGSEALEFLQTQRFDLVLLDIEMPEMNGLEVLMNLRQSHRLTELPVIMVTGRDQTGDMVATLQLGANDYVAKPYNFPVVLARVQTQLALKHSRSASGQAPAISQPETAAPASLVGSSVGTHPVTAPRPTPRLVTTPDTPHLRGSREAVSPTRSPDKRDTSPAGQLTPSDILISKAPQAPAAAPLIAGFEVLGELGRGGMGIVYKARHLAMNRLVALKVIDHDYLAHPDAVGRFYQEVKAAAQLCHPNIVMAHDAGQVGDTHYLAMEYVEGVDLNRLVHQSGPFPVDQACDFVRQAALGLQHAFERGLVHRDIKPSNLLVTAGPRSGSNPGDSVARTLTAGAVREGTVKILDMGLALFHQPAESPAAVGLTREGKVVGTVDYMSPEQWMNAHKVDTRADLYSLGCTFYFLLTGQVPFPGPEPMEKMLKHHLDTPTPIEQLRPGVRAKVLAVVNRLMAKRPEDRFQTPAELVETLK